MTPELLKAIAILARVSVTPVSFDKRFIRFVVEKARDPEPTPLTPKQEALVWTMLHRYRRQHGKCPCLECFHASQPKGFSPYQQTLFDKEESK